MDKSKCQQLLDSYLEFADNKSNRIIICFCIDCSGSMLRQGAMKKVNDGLVAFLKKTDNDILARDAADRCIITFGDKASLVSNFGTPEEALRCLSTNPILPIGSGTVLAAGVNLALDHIPWLIIISDGDATELPEKISAAADRVQSMLRSHDLKTMCLNIGNGNSSLPLFTIDGKVGQLDNLRVTDFFDMLSRNVSQSSRAAIESGGPEFDRNWN